MEEGGGYTVRCRRRGDVDAADALSVITLVVLMTLGFLRGS